MAQDRVRNAKELSKDQSIALAYGIHRSHDALASNVEAFARHHRLEAAHLSMLHTLGLGGEMRMKDLASRVILGAATTTRRAKQLEERGLIQRKRSDESQREVLIRLTKKGNAMFEKSFANLHQAHRTYFDGRLSKAEQQMLERLLDKL